MGSKHDRQSHHQEDCGIEPCKNAKLGHELFGNVSVVVLDLHLPHVNGLDILAKIRGDERLKDAKVIISTADPRMSDMAEDADFVLIKPISFAQLRDLSKRLR